VRKCGFGDTGKPVQYKCECGDECDCLIIEFDEEPEAAHQIKQGYQRNPEKRII